MRILHILSQYPDFTGSGIYLQEMLRQSRKRGYQNFLIAGSGPQAISPDWLGALTAGHSFVSFEKKQLNFSLPGMSDIMPYPSSQFKALQPEQIRAYQQVFTETIQQAIAAFQPDIIHSHHLWLVSSLIKQLAGEIPVITSCHGSDLRQYQSCPHFQERVVKGCRKIDHILALSEQQQNEICRFYGIEKERITVVGAGVNTQLFKAESRQAQTTPVKLLYAGKLSYAKGVPYLLRALRELVELPFHITIVGSGTGEEARHCRDLSEALGAKATLRGSISQQKLAQEMKAADIFILPSLYEGMPLVVLEALSSNCRVLSTKLPGVCEIFCKTKSPNLYTIPLPELSAIDQIKESQKDIFTDNLRQSLQQLIGNSTSPLQSSINDIEYFSWDNVFSRIEGIYQKVFQG
ncbi:glycosyltransferase family 4 protein [Desulfotalea psychrophila]|uniref:Glycosyltransferase n=1 Tax=Desulfotalea psychrophila (strain LSv54 / DSM 12343) TaxID=177439 RepID=Q6AJD6_DESPS|nr:glycosyltransferase family 4 protein [Desulfotalea psychrophila]CAG37544.1 hypothetical protein DP2815 [Desulfotalea psychrophila LSv54]